MPTGLRQWLRRASLRRMPPPLERQITFLYAQDLAASRHFYETVLGLPLLRDQGRCAIYAGPGGALLGVCLANGPRDNQDPRREGGVVLTLVTPAVEQWHAHLLALGIATEGAPAESSGFGITHFFLRDPAGYLLEIQRFAVPLPAAG